MKTCDFTAVREEVQERRHRRTRESDDLNGAADPQNDQ
jgi:hypothetical protein